MRDILSNLSSGLTNAGNRVLNPELEVARLKREQDDKNRQALARIMTEQTIPEFARAGGAEPDSPENIKRAQLAQLAQLGTPEALAVISKNAPLMQERATPLSTLGKLQADVSAGMLPEDVGRAAIEKATTPSQPLVNVSTSGESAGQKELAKSRAARITNARELGDKASAVTFGANRLQEAIDRGNVGQLEPFKAVAVELAEGFGIPLRQDLVTKAKDVRAVEKILARGALDTLESLKGSTSNKDLDFAQRVSGRINQGKASLQELSDLMIAQATKAQQISDAVVQADLDGATLKEQDALIARLKKSISMEDLFNEIVSERLAKEPKSAPQGSAPTIDLSTMSTEELQRMLQGAP